MSRDAEVAVYSSDHNDSLSITMSTLQDPIVQHQHLSAIRIPKSVFSDVEKMQSIASVVYKSSYLFQPSVHVQQPHSLKADPLVISVVHALVLGTQDTENLTESITLIFKKMPANRKSDRINNTSHKQRSSCSFWVSGMKLLFLKRCRNSHHHQ